MSSSGLMSRLKATRRPSLLLYPHSTHNSASDRISALQDGQEASRWVDGATPASSKRLARRESA